MGKRIFQTLEEAQQNCLQLPFEECAGITKTNQGFEPRLGFGGKKPSLHGETAYLRQNIEPKSEFLHVSHIIG